MKFHESKGGHMVKKIFIFIFIAVFLISCQKGTEEIKNFTDDYAKVTDQLREKRSKVTKRDEYAAYKEELKKSYEDLLEKYKAAPDVDGIEILRSKVLLKLKKTEDAEKKIDKVLEDSPDSVAAKMVKVQILFEQNKHGEAHTIFKDIESEVKDQFDLFSAYYALAQEHPESIVKESYCKKFLETKDIPEYFAKYKTDMYYVLAAIAKMEGDFDKARRLYTEGMGTTEDERTKTRMQKTAAQLDYFGKEAFPVIAVNWLNSDALDLKDLKGKPVILAFWAPWCPSCRAVQPALVDMYNDNKDKGLTIVGFTRYYGSYRDDIDDKGKVTKEEELELIKKYLERKKIGYPIAVANEKTVYNEYKITGIPTMVFINKKGEIEYTKIGSGDEEFMKEKVKKLLEDS
jgi:thiol-disulfide isomerase/thioredoxin